MKYYGIDNIGIFKIQEVATLPTWTSNDYRRMIYVEDEEALYVGSDSEWVQFSNLDYTDGTVLDGDKVHIDWTPDYYIPTTPLTIEADSIDQVTAHLNGIDLQFYMSIRSLEYGGYFKRPIFTYGTTSSIWIGAGSYALYGTGTYSRKIVYWTNALLFSFSGLGPSQWQYIYIDESQVSDDPQITVASKFVNSSTAPTYNQTRNGWYNGDDRCIFCVRTNSNSQILNFSHDGGDLVMFDEELLNSSSTLTTSWATRTVTAPNFGSTGCSTAYATFYRLMDNTILTHVDGRTFYRKYGSTGDGHTIGSALNGYTRTVDTLKVITDGSQRIEVKTNNQLGATLLILTNGYYLPGGM